MDGSVSGAEEEEWPKGDYSPEGKYFFEFPTVMKATMLNTGVQARGPEMSPEQSIKDMKANLRTFVLVTLYCPGWSLGWATAVASEVVKCYSTCCMPRLVAIQGGPACDEEIVFLHIIMSSSGFTVDVFAKDMYGDGLTALS